MDIRSISFFTYNFFYRNHTYILAFAPDGTDAGYLIFLLPSF